MIKARQKGLTKNTLDILKKSKKTFLITFFISGISYAFLYGLWKIPILDFGFNRMSSISFFDYLFLAIISALTSIFFVLWEYERIMNLASNTAVGAVGTSFAGLTTALCPVCQGVVIAALGTTVLSIPLSFLVPYLSFIKVFSAGLLGFGVFLKAQNIHTQKCSGCITPLNKKRKSYLKEPFLFRNNLIFGFLSFLVFLILLNQLLIPNAFASYSLANLGSVNLGAFQYGSKITLKPMPLAANEQPKISGAHSNDTNYYGFNSF